MAAEVIILVGGSSSGKSQLAENMTADLACQNHLEVYYIATGTIWDQEFARRVEKHRLRRPAHWHTFEEPLDLNRSLQKIKDKKSVIMVDGIGTWIANHMYQEEGTFYWDDQQAQVLKNQTSRFIQAWEAMEGHLLIVADEVGMDVVPENAQARLFRDINGQINQQLAQAADRVYLVVCGLPVRIK